MKLVYSLINPHIEKEHGNDVYQMFILSAIMGKDLGYDTTLYASVDVINKIGKWFDEAYIINFSDFKFYDDIKIQIWERCDYKTITIDGDVFLFDKLRFNTTFNKNDIVCVEAFDAIPKSSNVLHALRIFNEFNPIDIVNEWDKKNFSSLNTGIVRWSEYSNDFKMYYIKKYKELRDWFLYNEMEMNSKNNLLKTYSSVTSHFICEHLLYQLLKTYKLNYDILSNNQLNQYQHWKGSAKFTNIDKFNNIHNLLNYYIGGNYGNYKLPILKLYEELKNNNIITNIF